MEKSRFIAAYEGSLAGEALAMPVHWYYDRAALATEYGLVDHFVAPKSPHTGSFMAKSKFEPLNERANILHDQARYWGKDGVHYHQFLKAGENTLNLKLAMKLYDFTLKSGYTHDGWLNEYAKLMLTPGWQNDTYAESFHRGFFQNYAAGKALRECAVDDNNIGGLATVPALLAALVQTRTGLGNEGLQKIVKEHVALTHSNSDLIEAAAVFTRLLCAIVDGVSVQAAVRSEAGQWLKATDADAWMNEDDLFVVGKRFAPSCPIQNSMPGSLYLAYKHHADFGAAITANAMAGGENCYRGVVVGALVAAERGEVPEKFRVRR